ncbi:MAG: glycosyltransferase family 2 protein [Nitrospinae bacterium]|nr:glycosyltransferase family 2 protein [Nitrospinota bacterium]
MEEVECHLREVINEKEKLSHELQLHCNEFEKIVEQQRNAVIARDAVIDGFINSTSWKLTAPIRFVSVQWKNIALISKRKKKFFSLKKNLNIFRNEGIKGLKEHFTRLILEETGKDYSEWIRLYDTLTDDARKQMQNEIAQWEEKPLISIIMPTYNSKLELLIQAIESVKKQVYENWELCIADDASTDSSLRPVLEEYSKNDSRIKIVFRKENGHISQASNSALEIVSGGFVALLDHDDLLSEHALFYVVREILRSPHASLIYSDEDKVDENGHRQQPYFKPDLNPDLLLSHNYICHLAVYKTSLIKSSGGFRKGLEGAQDYDLALRCIENVSSEEIVHIPKVLYHWRIHPGSTALAGNEKNYALSAGVRALDDHFKRLKVSAKAELLNFGMYRIHYELTSTPLITIIIPTYNGLRLIKQSISSIIAKTLYPNYEILIVDNNSDDPETLAYFDTISKNEKVKVQSDKRPFNFSALNNKAVSEVKSEYILLLNNDIEVISENWLNEMVSLAIQPEVGCVGARLWYPDNTLQHGGVITGLGGVAGHSHKYLPRNEPGYFYRATLIQTLSAVTAACLLIKKSIYEQVGGFDEENLSIAFNDVDFCLKVRDAGYRNIWTPYAELYHHESASRGTEDTLEKKTRFSKEVLYMQKRWGEKLLNDPAYSPNLTLDYENFTFAWPPRI